MISFLEVCAFPPIRQKKANGWGTGLIQIHKVRDLVVTGPVPVVKQQVDVERYQSAVALWAMREISTGRIAWSSVAWSGQAIRRGSALSPAF